MPIALLGAAKRDELSHAQLACDVSRSHRFRRAPRAVPDLRWTKTSGVCTAMHKRRRDYARAHTRAHAQEYVPVPVW
eukprot:5920514-Pleurochrysis_carterae.AAC.3